VSMSQIRLVRLDLLMKLSRGRSEIVIGLIDGPVAMDHPDLQSNHIRFAGRSGFACSSSDSVACRHGTFVAGILFAQRGSPAPAICPDCSLLLRPIFPERDSSNGEMPSAAPTELAAAIVEVVEADARIINLSAALLQPASHTRESLQHALDFAAARGVITVAAAGNQGTLGSSIITRHPWVIPVTGCDLQGRPTTESNLGSSIGRRGLAAPGENVTSLGTDGKPETFGGTSAAAPFVTGAIALLWSQFPSASAARIKLAVTQAGRVSRRRIAPPLLDAWAAYQAMSLN
jgi:subtilisin family serine protease